MTALSADALATLFSGAHTHNLWHDLPVSDDTLRQLHEAMKWAPTATNACPARVVFVRSREQKERLLPCMAEANVEKTRSAPVTAIFAFDSRFYDKLPMLYPQVDARSWFAGDPVKAEGSARLNAGLQGGYFILAARAVGLDCGPMAGFDAAKVNETFFADGQWKTLFVCNLGYGDPAGVRPRNPRLAFDEVCRIV